MYKVKIITHFNVHEVVVVVLFVVTSVEPETINF